MVDTALKKILKSLPASETNLLAKCFLCRNSGTLIEIDDYFLENAIQLQQKGLNIMLSKATIHLDQDLAAEFCIRMPPKNSQSLSSIGGTINRHFKPIHVNENNDKKKESLPIAKRHKVKKQIIDEKIDNIKKPEKMIMTTTKEDLGVIVPHYVTSKNREESYELDVFSVQGYLSLPSQYLHAPPIDKGFTVDSIPNSLDQVLEHFLFEERRFAY